MGPFLLGLIKPHTFMISQNLNAFGPKIVELCLKTCSSGFPVTYVTGRRMNIIDWLNFLSHKKNSNMTLDKPLDTRKDSMVFMEFRIAEVTGHTLVFKVACPFACHFQKYGQKDEPKRWNRAMGWAPGLIYKYIDILRGGRSQWTKPEFRICISW